MISNCSTRDGFGPGLSFLAAAEHQHGSKKPDGAGYRPVRFRSEASMAFAPSDKLLRRLPYALALVHGSVPGRNSVYERRSSCRLRVAPNGFRVSACEHAIQDRAADGDLCALSRKRSCTQARPDDPLVSTYCRFNQGVFAVASGRLPTQTAIFVDRCYVIVSLAAGFGLSPLRRVRTWWNDDPSFGAVTHNCVISWITVIGAIGSELTNLVTDLVEQGFHLRDIASFLIRQGMSNNLAAIGIESQM